MKMTTVILSGFFSVLMFTYKGTRTMKVVMDKDITTSIGTSNIVLRCHIQPATGDVVLVIGLFARNKTTDNYLQIAAFFPSSGNNNATLTFSGKYLAGRVSLTNPTETLNVAILSFNEIQCEDNTDYKCNILYNNDGGLKDEFSTSTKVRITSYPTIPDAIVPSVQLSEVENYQIVTFICIGNLGKPAPGKLIWRKQKDGKVLNRYYNVSTEIEDMPENCTFRGTSNLTLQITKNDQGAILECTEETLESSTSMWLQTKKINVKLTNGSPNTNGNNDFVVFYIILPIVSILSILSVVVAVVMFIAFWKKHQNGETSINGETRNVSSGHADTIDTNATNFYEILNAERDRSFHEYSMTNDHNQLHRNEGTRHETSTELHQYEHVDVGE